MADQVMNIGKGRMVELYNRVKGNDPAASVFRIILLKVTAADALLIDYDDLAALLAGSSVEADFTNYTRALGILTDSDLAALPPPDDSGNTYDLDFPDIVYASAGGATNNTLAKAILCYDATGSDADAAMLLLGHFDFVLTTDGTDFTLKFDAAGFFSAS